MLIACSSCHRQYDVGHFEVGEKLRCLCGELTTVPEPRSHVARIQHCSSCGAGVPDGATSCDYCGGGISLEERNLGAACPECFARLMKGASYCMECGVPIAPTAIRAERLESSCPRCSGPMILCTVERGHYTECGSCGGLWLEPSFFDRVLEARDASPLGKGPAAPSSGTIDEPPPQELRYLPCPTCGEMMNRKNFGCCSGVIIDWCKPHGVWFDTHELAKILRFVAEGGLDKARALELARAEQKLRRTQDRTRHAANAGGSSSARSSGFANADRLGTDRPFVPRASFDYRVDDFLEAIVSGVRRLFGR